MYADLMTMERIMTAALELAPPERARLAALLWESLGDAAFQAGAEEHDLAVACDRDREMEAGAARPVPHAEMMARLTR
ncbi:MAG TPA: addiction module protein [Verrucomicrobiota bacterium]|nr:addiction module protein [Verrucomicrobiota bacterium]